MIARTLFVSALTVSLFGCGGGSQFDLNEVSGTVTMDGKPLSDARVIFTPKGGGRAGFGMTDSNGNYKLAYSTTGEGTPAGEYVVAITTFIEPYEDEDGNLTEVVPERVPEVYVKNSELTATVPGGNYDFELKSDASPVVQPMPETMLERQAEEAGQ